ncbi:MAG: hypothetical protein ABI462_14295 [Ignavibacteria bacterium]
MTQKIKILLFLLLCYLAACGSESSGVHNYVATSPFITNTCKIYTNEIEVLVLSYNSSPDVWDRVFHGRFRDDSFDVGGGHNADFRIPYVPYSVIIISKNGEITVLKETEQKIEIEKDHFIHAILIYDTPDIKTVPVRSVLIYD